MRAKLRREISGLLKQLGIPSRLYKRGGGKRYFYSRTTRELRILRDGIQRLYSGTLVGDCDGFNHIVSPINCNYYLNRNHNDKGLSKFQHRLYKGNGYVFVCPTIIYEDGGISCGCGSGIPDPPQTRDYIESFQLAWYRACQKPNSGWPLSDTQKKRLEILESGGHITDENGILLEEFREK